MTQHLKREGIGSTLSLSVVYGITITHRLSGWAKFATRYTSGYLSARVLLLARGFDDKTLFS